MKSKGKRIRLAGMMFCLALAMWISASMSAFADTGTSVIDFEQKGSLTITLRDTAGKQAVRGADLRIYKVADIQSENNRLSFTFTEKFKQSGVSLDDLQNTYLAEHLSNFATEEKLDGIKGTAAGDSTVFQNLELGLYLVVQKGSTSGYYPISPFLVSIPMTGDEGNRWLYQVTADPKVSARPWTPSTPDKPTNPDKPDQPDKPSSEMVSLQVIKKWKAGDKANPSSVKAVLLQDGQAVETVTLNGKNDWTHTWKNLDSKYRWTVVESKVPSGFKASYQEKGNTVIITNTANKDLVPQKHNLTVKKVWDDSGKNRPESISVTLYHDGKAVDEKTLSSSISWRYTWKNLDESGKWTVKETKVPKGYTASYSRNGDSITITNANLLIQTGQLIWPIPVLAAFGILFFMAGWMIRRNAGCRQHKGKK